MDFAIFILLVRYLGKQVNILQMCDSARCPKYSAGASRSCLSLQRKSSY